MKFERFDGFYRQPRFGFPRDESMKFQRLELYAVPEEATRIAALRAGNVDIAPIGLSARDQVASAGARLVFSRYGVNVEPRMYGCWKPEIPGHDKRVRQALDYAINKKQIQEFYGGPEIFEIKGWYRLTPVSEGYTPEMDPRPFDPDKARELLAAAGYPRGAGFGKLVLNTFPSIAIPFQVETAQLGAATWNKELGLDVEVKAWEAAAYRRQERAGTPLWGQMAWQDNNPQYDIAVTVQGKYAGTTIERFARDPELIQLINQTYAEVDPAKRIASIQQHYLRLRDESYNLGVGLINIPWAIGPRIASWQPLPLSSYLSAAQTVTLR
jgi:peptide/nickel transport system substrate-binding protein